MCFHLLWIISAINKFTFKIKMAKPICSGIGNYVSSKFVDNLSHNFFRNEVKVYR